VCADLYIEIQTGSGSGMTKFSQHQTPLFRTLHQPQRKEGWTGGEKKKKKEKEKIFLFRTLHHLLQSKEGWNGGERKREKEQEKNGK
jgi:DNA polymerase III epsilon subunit-like protein